MITIEQVPMWGVDHRRRGHIVLQSQSHWITTACGTFTPSYKLTPKLPAKICAKCRAALAKLGPPQPYTEEMRESA